MSKTHKKQKGDIKIRRTAGEICEESSSVVLPTWEAVSLDEFTENRRLPADFHMHAHILIDHLLNQMTTGTSCPSAKVKKSGNDKSGNSIYLVIIMRAFCQQVYRVYRGVGESVVFSV